MTRSKYTIRSAVGRALCVGAFAAVAAYTPATLAQDADEPLEEITVTGTRIATQDYSSASPISTVDAELFSQTGAPTIETVLNTLPQFVPAVTSTSNNPSNGGQANVELRGLGPTRTLVLLDGRRIAPSNSTGVVDLNLIPASVIENVEIITGGASAVYGSEAIAGVVNIKTRQFTGLELTGGYGETSESDGQRANFGITGGIESDDGRGYAFGSFNWADRDGVQQGDRDFSAVALDWDGDSFEPLGSSTIRQGRWDALTSNLPSQAALDAYFAGVAGYTPGDAAPGNNYGFNPDGSLFNTAPVINFTGDTNEPLQPVNPAQYTYNFAPPNYLELPLERKTFFGKAGFEISEYADVYVQAIWADYTVDQALAPTPATSLYIRPDNPNLDPSVLAVMNSRPDPTEPFRFRKRMIESGPRISSNAYTMNQLIAGMKGDISFLDDWSYDLYASLGNVRQVENQLGNISRSAFEELSLAADHGASVIGQAINPFGIESLSPEATAYYTRSATNETIVKQQIVEGFVTGPVFEMPSGSAEVAVGYLFKHDDYSFLPDASLTATSTDPVTGSSRVDIVGFNAQDVVRGEIYSREIYAEGRLPLLSGITAVEALDFTVGYRYADHSVAGEMNSYKAEFTWDITSQFGARGGYQRAVRAPNISELFSPATINFPSVGLGDPCSNDFNDPEGNVLGAQDSAQARALCVAQGIPEAAIDSYLFTNTQFQGLQGGNPNLSEETADTVTAGLVWRGDGDGLFGNFSASVDYYQIEIEDVISVIDAEVSIERCFDTRFNPDFDNSNQFCQLFARDVGTGTIIDALEANANLANQEVRGIDFQVDYSSDLGPGVFRGKLIASNLLNWKEAITTADPFEEFAGTAQSNIAGVLPEWKTSLNFGYTWGGFDGDIRWRYIDETTDLSFPDFKLDAVSYYDLTLGYSFEGFAEGLRVRGGVINLSDEQPIIYPSQQQSNTDPSTYDVLGRRWFVNLTYSF
jgi:outer membrane receptor protein involved in Fe transport